MSAKALKSATETNSWNVAVVHLSAPLYCIPQFARGWGGMASLIIHVLKSNLHLINVYKYFHKLCLWQRWRLMIDYFTVPFLRYSVYSCLSELFIFFRIYDLQGSLVANTSDSYFCRYLSEQQVVDTFLFFNKQSISTAIKMLSVIEKYVYTVAIT